jgi:hypothetical protein
MRTVIVDFRCRALLKSLINNRHSLIGYFDEEHCLSTENVEEPIPSSQV